MTIVPFCLDCCCQSFCLVTGISSKSLDENRTAGPRYESILCLWRACRILVQSCWGLAHQDWSKPVKVDANVWAADAVETLKQQNQCWVRWSHGANVLSHFHAVWTMSKARQKNRATGTPDSICWILLREFIVRCCRGVRNCVPKNTIYLQSINWQCSNFIFNSKNFKSTNDPIYNWKGLGDF